MSASKFFILILLLATRAQADVLFVDVNNNPKEIASARAAAMARKEKLIVYPDDLTREAKAKIAALEKRLDDTDGEERFSIREEIKKYQNQVSGQGFKEKISALERNGTKLTAVIISGHDGNGSFTGSRGGFKAEDLREALAANPNLAAGIQSLYLWGCYTTTYGSCEAHWKKGMPNLGIVVGFEGSAPAQDKAANHTVLMDTMKLEKQLTTAKNEKDVRAIWNKIRNINSVSASICMNDKVVNKKKILDRGSLNAICEAVIREKKPQKWSERIACYSEGAKGCEDVPADTANGELRKIYNEIQEASHCHQVLDEAQYSDPEAGEMLGCWPNADQLLRLILNKQVVKNFAVNHQGDVDKYDQLVEQLKLGDAAKLGDVTKLSRAQLNQRLSFAQQAVASRLDDRTIFETKDAERAIVVQQRVTEMGSILTRVEPNCIPFNWVEPMHTDRSHCMNGLSPEGVKYGVQGALEGKVEKNNPTPPSYQAKLDALSEEARKIDGVYAGAYGATKSSMDERRKEILAEYEELEQKQIDHRSKAIEQEYERIKSVNPNWKELAIFKEPTEPSDEEKSKNGEATLPSTNPWGRGANGNRTRLGWPAQPPRRR